MKKYDLDAGQLCWVVKVSLYQLHSTSRSYSSMRKLELKWFHVSSQLMTNQWSPISYCWTFVIILALNGEFSIVVWYWISLAYKPQYHSCLAIVRSDNLRQACIFRYGTQTTIRAPAIWIMEIIYLVYEMSGGWVSDMDVRLLMLRNFVDHSKSGGGRRKPKWRARRLWA